MIRHFSLPLVALALWFVTAAVVLSSFTHVRPAQAQIGANAEPEITLVSPEIVVVASHGHS